jgi:hypothetical protein
MFSNKAIQRVKIIKKLINKSNLFTTNKITLSS